MIDDPEPLLPSPPGLQKTRRIRECVDSLRRLVEADADEPALSFVIDQLEASITELEMRRGPLSVQLTGCPPHWNVWESNLGYADKPYVRCDNMVVCQFPGDNHWVARFSSGEFIKDSKDRKRFWKYPLRAIQRLDDEFPVKEV